LIASLQKVKKQKSNHEQEAGRSCRTMLAAAVLLGLAAGCAGFSPAAMPAARSAALSARACAPLLGPSAVRTMPPAAFLGARLRGSSTRAARGAGSRGRAGGLRSLNAMFTGIVEEMGRVSMLKEEEMSAWDSPGKMVKGVTLTVDAGVVLDGAYEGCSIAVSVPAARRRRACRALRTRRALRACLPVPCASKVHALMRAPSVLCARSTACASP